MKSEVAQIIDNLEFCIETLGLNDEQTGDVLAATNEIGVNVEYFSNEFVFLTGRGLEEDGKLHDPEHLNIALFNAMYWEH